VLEINSGQNEVRMKLKPNFAQSEAGPHKETQNSLQSETEHRKAGLVLKNLKFAPSDMTKSVSGTAQRRGLTPGIGSPSLGIADGRKGWIAYVTTRSEIG
jgi:hypothetical protein